MEGTTPFNIDS